MHGGRIGKMVCEMDDQAVADLHTNKRTGNASVIRPGFNWAAPKLDRSDTRFEIHFDNLRVGIRIRSLGQPEAGIPVAGLNRWGLSGAGRRRKNKEEKQTDGRPKID